MKRRVFVLGLLAAPALAALTSASAQSPMAQHSMGQSAVAQYRIGDIEIRQPWSRATPSGSKVAAGYLEITNRGNAPDRLVAVSTSVSGKAELHEMATKDGVMTMRMLPAGVTLAPGQTVALKPGGLHVMFVGLVAPLKQGEKFSASLEFEKAGKIDVSFDIQAIGAREPSSAHGH
jgi:copper(I)-binding protein